MTRSYGIRVPKGVSTYPGFTTNMHNSVQGQIDTVAVQNYYNDTIDVPLLVKAATVTMDRTWSPYCQASIVCVQPTAAQLAQIEPRTGMRVRFELTQTVDGIDAAPQYFDLDLRGFSLDWSTGEVTLDCASNELWARDFGLNQASPQYAVAGTTSTTLSALVTGSYRMPPTLSTLGLGSNPAVTDPLWQPGQSWADYVAPVVEAAGAWLYCDEQGRFRLTAPTWVADTAVRTITDAAHIRSVVETVSRDDPTWSTTAVVSYTPRDGQGSTTFDVSRYGGDDVWGKLTLLARIGSKPTAGAANAVVDRMRGRGRNLVVDCMLDIAARPNQSWSVAYQGLSRTGKAQSVAMSLPDGTMQLSVNT